METFDKLYVAVYHWNIWLETQNHVKKMKTDNYIKCKMMYKMLSIQSDQCNDIMYFVFEWCDRHVKSNAIFFFYQESFL